ncbi:19163_t:CDS:2, partial [Gigaspora rosea]
QLIEMLDNDNFPDLDIKINATNKASSKYHKQDVIQLMGRISYKHAMTTSAILDGETSM